MGTNTEDEEDDFHVTNSDSENEQQDENQDGNAMLKPAKAKAKLKPPKKVRRNPSGVERALNVCIEQRQKENEQFIDMIKESNDQRNNMFSQLLSNLLNI